MAGIPVRTQGGPQSYDVAEAITGGQLVEARDDSQVGVAAADSTTVLGVALNDAVTAASISTGVDANNVLNAAPLPTRAVVAKSGHEVALTYAADADFGQRLKAAAAGAVTPFVSGTDTDPALVVAICTEPAGVTVATKATGLARIL
ncbi:MAG: hypothetical protein QM638_01215 [Nocardioides sp.]|uniref:hypothetical protein n=1 Tax=Nocardioides sp. TaxID=35761 RepID=UPI0039E67B6D